MRADRRAPRVRVGTAATHLRLVRRPFQMESILCCRGRAAGAIVRAVRSHVGLGELLWLGRADAAHSAGTLSKRGGAHNLKQASRGDRQRVRGAAIRAERNLINSNGAPPPPPLTTILGHHLHLSCASISRRWPDLGQMRAAAIKQVLEIRRGGRPVVGAQVLADIGIAGRRSRRVCVCVSARLTRRHPRGERGRPDAAAMSSVLLLVRHRRPPCWPPARAEDDRQSGP
jgi:hypothetical protein